MTNKIFSIIVTFNPDLLQFADVIESHLNTNVDSVVIVDNDSNNSVEIHDLIQKLIKKKPVIFVKLIKNEGIGYAQNEGIKKAFESNCTHIVLFDQDSKISYDFVENLLEQENELNILGYKVGAIGPVYIDPRSKNFYPLIRTKGIFIEKVWPDREIEKNIKASFIIASGSLIKTSTINEVGLMDDSLFIDCVDIEWCFRAASKGYLFFASKSTEISHSIGDKRVRSLGREISIHSPLRRYYMIRNNLILSKIQWVPLGYRARIVFGLVLNVSIHLFDVSFKKEYVKFTFKGILDGILNKKGAYI